MREPCKHILLFFVVIAILGCDDKTTTAKILLQAEKLMNAQPDSSYILLNQLVFPGNMSEKEMAAYALLMEQAIYKKRLPMESDSLIRIAEEYYGEGKDSIRKGWCYFLYGRYHHENNDKKKALEFYQKASLATLGTSDYKLNEQIYNCWGTLLLKEKPYDDGVDKLTKSLEYARMGKDTIAEGFVLRNLGLSYMWKGDWDRALKIHHEGIKLARNIKDNDLLVSLYNNLSIVYWKKGEYSLALDYLNTSMDLKQDTTDNAAAYAMKGVLFFAMERYDSARYYIEKQGLGNTLYSKANYYDGLSLLEEKLGNYKKALQYRSEFANYMDSIRNGEKDCELIALQRKYDYSIIQNENNRLKLTKQKNEIIMLGFLFIIILLFLLYWGYYYKKGKEREALIRMKDDLVKQSVIELQKKTVQLQKQQQELLSRREELSFYQQKEKDLKSRIWKMDTIIQKIESINSYNEIKQNRSIAELVLSNKELADLEETVNLCYDNFAIRLRQDFPKLKEDDVYLCCLVKVRVPNKNIACLLNTNEVALKKRRYRIKHDRMELSDEIESLEQFLSQY